MEICCSEGSSIWWEGQANGAATEACAQFGIEDANRVEEHPCEGNTVLAGFTVAPVEGSADLTDQAWTQFCDSSSCGVALAGFSVVCGQPGVPRGAPPPADLVCPLDSVIETIYMHWDEFGIHSIDGIDCRPIYTPAPQQGDLFSDGCDADTPPTAVDLRCQGAALDTCGCLSVPTISPTPYYGCVLSGYFAQEQLPLVTLPGVIEPGEDPGCLSDPKATIPAGVWNAVSGANGCLTATDLNSVEFAPCTEGDTAQQWRLLQLERAEWNAMESMQFPGMCAVRAENGGVVPTCSCAELSLQQAAGLIGASVAPAAGPIALAPVIEAPAPVEPIAPEPMAPEAVVPGPVPVAPAPVELPVAAPAPVVFAPEPLQPALVPIVAPTPVPIAPAPITPAPVPITPAPVQITPAPAPITAAPVPGPVSEAEQRASRRDRDGDNEAVDPDMPPDVIEFPPAEADPYADDQYADDAYDPYTDSRRRLMQLPLPEVCGVLPTLITWQSGGVYEFTALDRDASLRLPGAQAFLDATKAIGGAKNVQTKLGAPKSLPANFRDATVYNPVHVCGWRRVLCGPEGPLQVIAIGGEGMLPPELLSAVPPLRGVAIYGTNLQQPAGGLLPDLGDDSQVVAIHLQETNSNGTVPCSWAEGGLKSLGLIRNRYITGPLEICFAAITDDSVIINIADSNPAAPICGSGSTANPVSRQLPKCSDLPAAPTTSVPVSLALDDDTSCEDAAETLRTFLVDSVGFAMDPGPVTCNATASSRRRLRQGTTFPMLAEVSGPGADWVLGSAIQEDSLVFNDLEDAFGGSLGSIEATTAPPPATAPRPDASPAAPPDGSDRERDRRDTPADAQEEEPVDAGDGGDNGDDGDSTRIIIIAVVAVVVVAVIATALFLCCRKKGKKKDEAVGSVKSQPPAAYMTVDPAGGPEVNSGDAYLADSRPLRPTSIAKQPVSIGDRDARSTADSGVVQGAAERSTVSSGYTSMPGPPGSAVAAADAAAAAAADAYRSAPPPDAVGRPVVGAAWLGTNTAAFSTNVLPVTGDEQDLSRAPGESSPQPGHSPGVIGAMPSTSSDVSEMSVEGDGSMISRSLSKVKTTGNARRSSKETSPALPSASNNYPHSEELAKMSSREIHRRMRSPAVSGSRKSKGGGSASKGESFESKPDAGKGGADGDAASDSGVTPPLSQDAVVRPAQGYVAAAVASGGGPASITPPHSTNAAPGVTAQAEAARVRDTYAALHPHVPVSRESELLEEKNGMSLRAVKRRAAASGGTSEPNSPDEFSTRVGNTFMMGFTGELSQDVNTVGASAGVTGGLHVPGDEGSGEGSPDSRGAVSVSSFTSVSVMSESTTVYTDVGNKDADGDAMTKLEQVLNRVQRELGGQVGSFRLKGIRHRFTGRSSIVAFADGMWGGEFALKFFSDPEAAQTEFNIYRQATNMQMALPPVQEIEDNTGGVLRLKDGTPLPPYLAMPRGLPLPDWYATHRPRQVATLTMLSQLLYRLEKLHVSGYCHNDIKPANMVLLDAGTGRQPEWHIVDFTNMAQIGSQTRARYTLEYASPEVIRAVGAMRAHYVACQPSMDVWSMGVIVFEVLTSKPFFPMDYNREAMKDGLIGLEPLPVEEDPRLFSKIPAEGKLRATVKMMLARDTEKRPTAAMVGKAIKECLRELTGEAPEAMDASPVSSLNRDESTSGL